MNINAAVAVIIIVGAVVDIVVVDPRNISMKFGQNRFSNSWDIASIVVVVECRVNPNLGYVELSWVGVVVGLWQKMVKEN